ncbi:MAG: glycosyltransferase family 39 protein [Myxococcales bacterium]|nr:glycosyltransferase family 39 protein [Myxococcales bacterium]
MPDSDTRWWATDPWIAFASGFAVFLLFCGIETLVEFDGYFVKYNMAARQYLDGNLPIVRLTDLSPLYFQLCVLAERWFPGPVLAVDSVGWVQRAAVSASAGLLYLILVPRLSRAWALAGVLIFAFEPHVLVYVRIYEPEIVLVFFLLGCIAAADRRSLRSALWAGVFAGCAIATRPTFLPLFVLLGPVSYGLRGNRGRGLLTRSAAFLLPVILCGILLGLRAERVTGDWSSPVMNPGTVFFEGNHPLSRGISAEYPPIVASMIEVDRSVPVPDEAHVRYRGIARIELERNPSIEDVNAFWAGKALSFIRAEPVRYVKGLADKALRIFRDYRWHDIENADSYASTLPNLDGFFAALCSFALVGMVWELRRWRVNLFFYAYVLAQIGVMLIFYVSARQQIVTVPPLIFFAAAAGRSLLQLRSKAIPWLVVIVPLFVVLLRNGEMVRDELHMIAGRLKAHEIAREIKERTSSTMLASQPELVAQMLAAASWLSREITPGNVGQEDESSLMAAVRVLGQKHDRDFFDEFDLAVLEVEAGALADAQLRLEGLVETGRLAYRGHQQASDPLFYLGRIAGLQGRSEEAVEILHRALERTPGDPYVLAELMVLGGEPKYRAMIQRYYSVSDAQLLLGESYLIHDRADQAIVELKALLRHLPRSRRAGVALAVAYGKAGKLEEGVEVYRDVLKISSTPVIWNEGVSELYRHWAASRQDDLEVQLDAARILYFHGRFREALEMLRATDSQNDPILDMIYKIRTTLSQVPVPTH